MMAFFIPTWIVTMMTLANLLIRVAITFLSPGDLQVQNPP